MGERNGSDSGRLLYAVERVLLLTATGALLGLALGLIFDNKHIAKSFSIGGAVAGLLVGLVLEMGFASRRPAWSGAAVGCGYFAGARIDAVHHKHSGARKRPAF